MKGGEKALWFFYIRLKSIHNSNYSAFKYILVDRNRVVPKTIIKFFKNNLVLCYRDPEERSFSYRKLIEKLGSRIIFHVVLLIYECPECDVGVANLENNGDEMHPK